MTALPEGWSLSPLSEVGQWGGGGTPSKANKTFWQSGTIPWVSSKDMKQDILRDSELHITEEAIRSSSTRLVPSNSVAVVARSGILEHTLPVALVPFEATFNQDLKVVTPRQDVLPKFLMFALKGRGQEILQSCRKAGTTVASIEWPLFLRFQIPLPPLVEQDRIVEILEEQFSRLDSALASIRVIREKAASFRRSLLHSAFGGELTGGTEGWRKVVLGEIVVSVRETHPMKPNEKYELWSVPSFADGKPEIVSGSEIKSAKLAVEAGDVLISKINPRINRVWVVTPEKGLPQISSTEWLVARVRKLDTCQPTFLRHCLSAPKFREWIVASASSVTGSHMRAKSEKILEQEIGLPPLATQQRIVSVLEEQFSRLDNALRIANQLEARIASERRSLLHAAFEGKLTAKWRETSV